jgi:hypothetical protein
MDGETKENIAFIGESLSDVSDKIALDGDEHLTIQETLENIDKTLSKISDALEYFAYGDSSVAGGMCIHEKLHDALAHLTDISEATTSFNYSFFSQPVHIKIVKD